MTSASASNVGASVAASEPHERLVGPETELLLERANAELYRRNAFRVLGLQTRATPREIRREAQRLAVRAGLADLAVKPHGFLPLSPAPDAAALREAERQLGDPVERFVAELFWFAESPGDLESAVARWQARLAQSPGDVDALHALAVLHHAAALDADAGGSDRTLGPWSRDEAWRAAWDHWHRLIGTHAFWTALGTRIRELDDPRLTTGVARRLRSALPRALALLNARVAVDAAKRGDADTCARHVRILNESPLDRALLDGVLRESVDSAVRQLGTLRAAATAEAAQTPPNGVEIGESLVRQSEPILALLDLVLGVEHRTRNTARDDVSQSIVTCVVEFGTRTQDWLKSRRLLLQVRTLPVGRQARERLEQNLEAVESNLVDSLCFFCGEQKGSEKRAMKVEMHGNVARQPTIGGHRLTWNHIAIQVPRCDDCGRAHVRTPGRLTALGAGAGAISGATLGCWWLTPGALAIATGAGVVGGMIAGAVAGANAATPVAGQRSHSIARVFGIAGGLASGGLLLAGTAPSATVDFALGLAALWAGFSGLVWGAIGWWASDYWRPPRVKPAPKRNEFPRIQSLLKQGWKFGAKPAEANS